MIVVGLIATVAIVGPLMYYFALAGNRQRELAAAPPQQGEAVVKSVTYPQATEGVPAKEPVYRLEFHGSEYEVQGQTEARPGDHVRITYRAASQNEVYVDSIGAVITKR